MRELGPLTPKQLATATERLFHPTPGSRIEAAARYGVDLSLIVEQLRLTPAERAKKLEDVTMELSIVRGTARKRS